MTSNIFMSYSRREVGFVDDLSHQIEKAGFDVWLDFRNLIPGTPWSDQIDKGLHEADVLLFVVSKESIASPYVELEWRYALEHNKRVVLVLFEAVSLPPELQGLEWVDFRTSYRPALKELISRLNSPQPNEHPVPQTGFRAPLIVWVTALLAALAGLLSLFGFYTILLPWVLIPFAQRVLKRNFNYSQVQTALWLLTISIILFNLGIESTGLVNLDSNEYGSSLYYTIMGFIFLGSIPVSISLLLLLRSPALQRWGKPEANAPKFANLYKPNNPNPKPVKFYIDHAPQDGRFASHLSKGLIKYKHVPVADIQSAEAVFVLISRFQTDTEADPEAQVVFPVLVQTAQPSEKLSRVQWIDFRRGIRNLDAIAQLLPQPAKMLAALGVRPTNGAQVVLPGSISGMVTYLTMLIVLDVISVITYILQVFYIAGSALLVRGALYFFIIFLTAIALVGLSYFSIRALTERRGRLASLGLFLSTQLMIVGLAYWQGAQQDALYALIEKLALPGDISTGTLTYPALLALGGVLLLGTYGLFQLNTIRRWFPAAALRKESKAVKE